MGIQPGKATFLWTKISVKQTIKITSRLTTVYCCTPFHNSLIFDIFPLQLSVSLSESIYVVFENTSTELQAESTGGNIVANSW